ncbi:MAG: hypothetical protein WAU86_04075 [Oricola sp.]
MTTTADNTQDPLSDLERETLLCIAGHMIPASAEYGIPGADDPAIFADILRSVGRDRPVLGEALRVVSENAGGRLAALSEANRDALLAAFRAGHPALAGVIESVTARCYYRDDRVMASIGMEIRPPFPLGYDVQQGDWSLLEPVRARGKIYRDAD